MANPVNELDKHDLRRIGIDYNERAAREKNCAVIQSVLCLFMSRDVARITVDYYDFDIYNLIASIASDSNSWIMRGAVRLIDKNNLRPIYGAHVRCKCIPSIPIYSPAVVVVKCEKGVIGWMFRTGNERIGTGFWCILGAAWLDAYCKSNEFPPSLGLCERIMQYYGCYGGGNCMCGNTTLEMYRKYTNCDIDSKKFDTFEEWPEFKSEER